MQKVINVLLIMIILLCNPYCSNHSTKIEENLSSNDFVPNEETAKKIAEAVWLPIYGNKIYDEKPYKTYLKDNIWVVTGFLPQGYIGGTAYIEIRKSDGKILKVTHGK
jgi:hypothetical protein